MSEPRPTGPTADPSAATNDPDDPGGVERSPWRGRAILAGIALAALAFVLWWFQPQALLFDRVVDEDFPAAVGVDETEASDTDGTGTGDATGADEDAGADQGSSDADDPASGDAADDGADDDAGDTDPDTATDGDGSGSSEGAEDGADTGEATSFPAALASGTFESRNRYTVTGTATTFALEDGSRVLRLEDFESTNGPDLFVYLTAADAADDDPALDADFVDLGVLTGNIGNQNYVIGDDVDLDRYDTVVIWCRRFSTSFGVADLDALG